MSENNENKSNMLETLLKTPAFYGFVGVGLILVVLLVLALVFAGLTKNEVKKESAIKVGSSAQNANDGTLLYEFSGSYQTFLKHENGKAIEINEKNEELKRPEVSPDETPDKPVETPSRNGNKTQKAGNDYYVFDLVNGEITARKLEKNEKYDDGIGIDDKSSKYTVGGFANGLSCGSLLIENNYGAAGFDIRDILSEPVSIFKSEKLDWARAVLVHTFTGQGYCMTEEDRVISEETVITGVNLPNNIINVGLALESASEKKQVGIAQRSEICDKVLGQEYLTSNALATKIARMCTTCELTLDIQCDAFERPAGTRYFTTCTKDGKDYAQVRFVVSQNESNPNWKENVKFAMLMIQKLEKKVPGISRGISLRPEA